MLEEETSGKKKSITKTPKKSKISTAITRVEENELQSLNNQIPASSIDDEQLNETETSKTSNAVGDKNQMSFNETSKLEKIAENPTQKTAHISIYLLIRRIYKNDNSRKFIFIFHRRQQERSRQKYPQHDFG